MEITEKVYWPKPGKYVVAVSGGVDSVVLLYLLKHAHPVLELVVAHANHGWRPESEADAGFVGQLAEQYGLRFELANLQLKTRSEAEARQARYAFLESARKKHRAQAIITAHHLDDRIETAVFNIQRGSNIYGLSALKSTGEVVRPLLNIRKKDLVAYARGHNLKWVEDRSNLDTSYARNRIRHETLPRLRKKHSKFDDEFIVLLAQADGASERLSASINGLIRDNAQISRYSVDFPMGFIKTLNLPTLRHVIYASVKILQPAAQLDAAAIEQAALQLKNGRLNRPRKLNSRLNVVPQGDKVSITVSEAINE